MKISLHRILFLSILFTSISSEAQSYAFGFKTGITAARQTWDNFGDDVLFKVPFIAFIETADNDKGSLFAQLGYHVKGAASRFQGISSYIDQNGNLVEFKPDAIEYKFYNLSLATGFKKKYPSGKNFAYWLLAIRGDYTVGTNFKEFEEINLYRFFYPDNQFVRKFNYGMTIGGGYEFPINELVGGILEFTVNPDLSKQYRQPAIGNLTDGSGQTYFVPERQVSNITLELTLGLRFLNKVEYID